MAFLSTTAIWDLAFCFLRLVNTCWQAGTLSIPLQCDTSVSAYAEPLVAALLGGSLLALQFEGNYRIGVVVKPGKPAATRHHHNVLGVVYFICSWWRTSRCRQIIIPQLVSRSSIVGSYFLIDR